MTTQIRFTFGWTLLKSQATADQRFHSCTYSLCRKRSRCMGGPRGTQRAFGKPKCTVQCTAKTNPKTSQKPAKNKSNNHALMP